MSMSVTLALAARVLLGILLLATVGYVLVCGLLFAGQRAMIYAPQPAPAGAPPGMALPVDGAQLRITTRPHDGDGALVYFGGNAEAVDASLPALAAAFPDRALYLMNYRGYGGSTGSPSETALMADGLALFDAARARHGHVVVMGRSLGSGVAVHVAAQRPVDALVLVTPYDSLLALARAQFPWAPVDWLLRDRYASTSRAPQVVAPTFVLAAGQDEVIALRHTQALLRHFRPGVAELQVLPDASHNTILSHPDYEALLRGWPPSRVPAR